LNSKISDKDKKVWEEFINSKDKILNKDIEVLNKNFSNTEKTIDLHGCTLNDANIKIEKFILFCFEKKIKKIKIITGKGKRSKNINDPYQSKDLSILKYSVPNYIKNNTNLMSKILKIDFDSVESLSEGSFELILKKKND
tara:strand:- start:1401 stop:1820 length:420 start_codon:yes stop_codon:yes gene_type:complete